MLLQVNETIQFSAFQNTADVIIRVTPIFFDFFIIGLTLCIITISIYVIYKNFLFKKGKNEASKKLSLLTEIMPHLIVLLVMIICKYCITVVSQFNQNDFDTAVTTSNIVHSKYLIPILIIFTLILKNKKDSKEED